MNGFVSPGFSGRRRTREELADRLPPGQYAESGFPVLTAGPTLDVATMPASIDGRFGLSASADRLSTGGNRLGEQLSRPSSRARTAQ